MPIEWEVAGIGFLGVILGSILALAGTVWVAHINATEARNASHRTYLMGMMQQLIEARMEFEEVLYTRPQQHELIKPVSRAIAVAKALGDADISNTVMALSAKPIEEIGLTLIDYVIQQLSDKIKMAIGN